MKYSKEEKDGGILVAGHMSKKRVNYNNYDSNDDLISYASRDFNGKEEEEDDMISYASSFSGDFVDAFSEIQIVHGKEDEGGMAAVVNIEGPSAVKKEEKKTIYQRSTVTLDKDNECDFKVIEKQDDDKRKENASVFTMAKKAQTQEKQPHCQENFIPDSHQEVNQQHHQHRSSQQTINSYSFNQDKNCIAIATSNGYRIRTLPASMRNCTDATYGKDTSLKRHQIKVHQMTYPPILPSSKSDRQKYHQQTQPQNTKSGLSHIQILHSTSVIAVVKKSTPRVISILHAKTAQCILEIPFTNAIRRIELNIHTMAVLTADGILHIFHLKGNGGGSGEKKEKGVEFLQTISILHSSESTRMMTADSAKTSGAFFDLSSHLFTSSSVKASRSSSIHKNGENASSTSPSSWLVTKSDKGIGYISVYMSCSKTIFMTKHHENVSNISSSKTPTIQKKTKVHMQLVETFQAHAHGIARIAIGGASNAKLEEKVFATVSVKVCVRFIVAFCPTNN